VAPLIPSVPLLLLACGATPVGAQVAKLGALVEVTSWARGVLQEAVWVLLLLLLLLLLLTVGA